PFGVRLPIVRLWAESDLPGSKTAFAGAFPEARKLWRIRRRWVIPPALCLLQARVATNRSVQSIRFRPQCTQGRYRGILKWPPSAVRYECRDSLQDGESSRKGPAPDLEADRAGLCLR